MDKLNMERLWVAANTHSVVHLGETLIPEVEPNDMGVPDMPENALELVIDYLKDTA